jgi:NifU-like domain
MAEPALVDQAPRPLGDPQVEQRLARLDELLGQVEATPGPGGALAMEAVTTLVEVYGEALARALAAATTAPVSADAVERMVADPLLGHLFALHGVHPEPVERRIERALDRLRPALGSNGADVALVGTADGVAEIRLPTGCGSGDAAAAVREAVLAVAPELADVRPAPPVRAPAFVPVTAIGRRPGAGP